MSATNQIQSVTPRIQRSAGRAGRGDPRARHLWTIAAVTALILAAAAALLAAAGAAAALIAAALLVSVPAAVAFAAATVDFHLILFARKHPPLPRLSRTEAAPAIAATAVVHPVIVYGDADVAALLTSIAGTRRATGPGFAAHLALVDFADGDAPVGATDARLRAAIEAGVAAIEAAHPGAPVAALFRRRRWNHADGVWMGWERKRGKIEEFVALISGDTTTSFEPPPALPGIRYVFTIDVGNLPYPDGVWRLVATIAHPDNAPRVDPRTGLVGDGFAFVRATDIAAPPGSVFEWILAPYPVPEGELPLPQSVFGQDVFYGQGVFDVAAYRAVLSGRIPADRVLSHDKLESMFGRAGVIADARVVEATIPEYLQFRRREHRWMRGDVQLLPWVFAPDRGGRRRLAPTDRALMVRDVLSHLHSASLVALFVLGWLAAPAAQVGWWTGATLVAFGYPLLLMPMFPLVSAVRAYVQIRRARSRGHHRSRRGRRSLLLVVAGKCVEPVRVLVGVEARRILVWLPLLLDRTLNAVDAVARGLWRSLVSHRRVLQWTSSVAASRVGDGLGVRIRRMWLSSALALTGVAALAAIDPTRLIGASPVLLAWVVGPWAAYRSGRPARRLPDSDARRAATRPAPTGRA